MLEKKKLSGCGKCKIARYCNKECQIQHWQQNHKHRCKEWLLAKGIEASMKERKEHALPKRSKIIKQFMG